MKAFSKHGKVKISVTFNRAACAKFLAYKGDLVFLNLAANFVDVTDVTLQILEKIKGESLKKNLEKKGNIQASISESQILMMKISNSQGN